MTKKEYLTKILEKLLPYRDLAGGILALIQEIDVDEKIIEGITKLIEEESKKQKSTKIQRKFNQTLIAIKKIQEQEEVENSDDNIEDILNKI